MSDRVPGSYFDLGVSCVFLLKYLYLLFSSYLVSQSFHILHLQLPVQSETFWVFEAQKQSIHISDVLLGSLKETALERAAF